MALGYGLDDRGFLSRQGLGIFLFTSVQIGTGAHPAFYPLDSKGSFPGGKRPGRGTDHSPPFIAGVKEYVELYIQPSSVKAQGQFYLYYVRINEKRLVDY
jgi:hypothetical protein